jgi:xylan 1,4-beta-xylosidase
MFMIDCIRETKELLRQHGFEDLPVFLTEWNTQTQSEDWHPVWVGNEYVNNLFAGAGALHLAVGCDKHLDMMAWWVASDVFEEGGPQVEPYGHRFQYYGLLTIDGLPKSSYHAFSFLSRMTGQRYRIDCPTGQTPLRKGLVTDERSCTRALFWNTVFPYRPEAAHWTFRLTLPVPRHHRDSEEVRICIAHVKEGQGSAYEYWKKMGSPPNLTAMEQEVLAMRALPAYQSSMMEVSRGKVELAVDLGPNEFVFIEVGGDPPGCLDELDIAKKQLNDSLNI